MGRLIDENEVIETLKQTGIIQDNDLGHCVIAEINRIPTAYDVDAVVEQLEDYGNEECAYYENTPYKNVIVECIGKAIQLVKGGGVDGN